ncbi:MAG: LysE family transporter, partial [Pseudomonadota bacterium]
LSANAIQMTAAAFGLAALIASSAEAFQIVKWAGVAYLAWIGISLMRSRGAADGPGAGAARAPLRLFRQGFVTSMANPFAVVFFGALFPQFIDPATPVLPQLAILGATYLVVDGAILLAWGWLGLRAGAFFRQRGAAVLNRICGALMVAAAALLAVKDITPAEQR